MDNARQDRLKKACRSPHWRSPATSRVKHRHTMIDGHTPFRMIDAYRRCSTVTIYWYRPGWSLRSTMRFTLEHN